MHGSSTTKNERKVRKMADNIDVRLTASGAQSFTDDFNRAADSVENLTDQTESAKSSISGFSAVFSAVQRVVQAGLEAIVSSTKAAIQQYDTMKNFPKLMEQMGFSAETVSKDMNKMQDAIEALPTTIDEMVASARNIAMITKDMDKATDIAIAMNNAFYASGSSASDASRGLNQFNQMMAAGKVDMQSWRTLLETMPLALDKVAESFGYVGSSAKNDLYAALQSGEVTFTQFADRIVELNDATEDFVGFAELAKTATGGLGTAMQNLGNAIVKGVAESLEEVDKALTRNKLPTMAGMVDKARAAVTKAFTKMAQIIGKVVDVAAKAYNKIKPYLPAITTALKTALAGFLAYKVVYSIMDKVKAGIENAKKAVQAFFTTIEANPIGVFISAIAGVVSAFLALRKATQDAIWSTESFAKNKALSEAATETAESYKKLADEHRETMSAIDTESSRVDTLVHRYDQLTGQTFRSAAEKRELSNIVKELNEIYPDLNAEYDMENDRLSEGNSLIRSKIQLSQKEKKMAAIEDAIADAVDAQTAARTKLSDATKENQRAQEAYAMELQAAQASGFYSEYYYAAVEASQNAAQAVKDLTETEAQATADLQDLYAQKRAIMGDYEEAVLQAYAEQQAALNAALANNTLTMDMLTEENQATVEELRTIWQGYKDDATNLFSSLSDEITLTVEEMQANLDENQRVINEWGDNMESLRDRFAHMDPPLDQALLDQLANIGPEGAGYVKELASASNDELINLATTYQQGGDAATDALLKAFDIKDVDPAVVNLVTRTEDSLRSKVKSTDWASIGYNVDAGFANGMDKYAYLVEQAAMRIANIPNSVIRAENYMHSPSKLMEKLGGYIGEGFALGIEDTQKVVASAATQMANVSQYIRFPEYVTGSYRMPAAANSGIWSSGQTTADGLRDVVDAINTRPIVLENTIEVNGRAFAKEVTTYVTEEQQDQAAFRALRKGERI